MACTKCGAENAPAAKFCRGCGSPLGAAESAAAGARCPQCANLCAPAAKFCPKCGHSFLQAETSQLPPVSEQRSGAAATAGDAPASRTPLIIAAVVVIAIAVAGGGVYYWKFLRVAPAAETPEPIAPEPVVSAPVMPEPSRTEQAGAESRATEAPATVATMPEAVAPVPAAPPSPPAASAGLQPEIAARIGTMLRQGREYKAQLQYDKAIATAESVLMIDPGNRDAKRLMQEAKDGQQAALSSIEID